MYDNEVIKCFRTYYTDDIFLILLKKVTKFMICEISSAQFNSMYMEVK
jgi:hypothetical protein